MKKFRGLMIVLAGGLLASTSLVANATPTYLRSTVGAPWGQNTNETAMNMVFGNGNWADSRYETVNTASLFSAATSFIFMEGSDNNANELNAFLSGNAAAISSWVNGGGRLFVNAAPNEGGNINLGFGVTLVYPDYSSSAIAAGASPIFSGPFTPVTTSYTGNYFSHAHVTGAGLQSILLDDTGDIVLGEMGIGAGLGLFGGMTTTNWQSPSPDALDLRANIISYAANFQGTVPEPASLALLGIGLAGLGAMRRRKTG
jgi:hypothetical protein